MKRRKAIQAELFTPDEMQGGVKPRDHFEEEYVAAYLKYMQKLSDLDDRTCQILQSECDKATPDGPIGKCTYRIKTLSATINTIHFCALKECVDMRLFTLVNKGFCFDEDGLWRINVTYPEAFVKAREIFKERFSAKYEGKDAWITDMSCKELLGFDKIDVGGFEADDANG